MTFDDVEVDIFQMFLWYIRKGELRLSLLAMKIEAGEDYETDVVPSLPQLVKLWALAQRFLLPELQNYVFHHIWLWHGLMSVEEFCAFLVALDGLGDGMEPMKLFAADVLVRSGDAFVERAYPFAPSEVQELYHSPAMANFEHFAYVTDLKSPVEKKEIPDEYIGVLDFYLYFVCG